MATTPPRLVKLPQEWCAVLRDEVSVTMKGKQTPRKVKSYRRKVKGIWCVPSELRYFEASWRILSIPGEDIERLLMDD